RYFKFHFMQENKARSLPIYQAISGNKNVNRSHFISAANILDARSEGMASVISMSEAEKTNGLKFTKISEDIYISRSGIIGESVILRPNGQSQISKGLLTIIFK